MTSIQSSLLRQAGRRLWLAFLTTLAVVGAASSAFYYAAMQRSAAVHGESLGAFYQDRLRHLHDRWEVQALQLKNQLELARILEQPDNLQARTESFFTMMGDGSGYENVHIDDGDDKTLFARHNTMAAVPLHTAVDAPPHWYFDSTSHVLHRVFSLPIWLGKGRGTGHLHWYVPIDNGLLFEMATHDGELYALWQDQVVAASAGMSGAADAAALAGDTTRIEDTRLSIQRRVDWGDEAQHPVLVVRHRIARPITSAELWIATLVTLVVMLLALALVLGVWLLRTGHRMALLGEASRQFAHSRALSPLVAGSLAQAGAETEDEIREVAAALGELIQGVVDRERERDEKEAELGRYLDILDTARDVIASAWPDGRIFYLNAAGRQLLGVAADAEDLGAIPDYHPPKFAELILHTALSACRERGYWEGETVFRSRQSHDFPVWQVIVAHRAADGSVLQYSTIARDLAERKRAEADLRLMATVFENSNEAILITDGGANIITVNAAFTRLTGYTVEEVRGRNPKVLSAGRSTREEYEAMWRAIVEQGYWRGEIWDRRKDGSVYPKWLSITAVRNDKGWIVNYIGSFSDITEHKLAEERIKHLAHHDALTGLPNRFSLQSRLAQAVAGARRNREKVAVMFIDLDRFKTINDTLGHHVGDGLLIAVANRLQQCGRASDIVARIGGDEFVVALPDPDSTNDVIGVAEKILASLAQPHLVEGHELHATPSIGISLYPDDAEDEDALMKNADIAMYHAKSLGRNNYQFFAASMNQAAVERLTLENQLRQALERQEFRLYYQPQIDLSSGRVVGAEALLRWQHPEAGLVSPATFIPILEDTGLIVGVGEWVLAAACRELKRWHGLGVRDVQVAVNLSARQFRQKNLAAMVEAALHEFEIEPGQIELEITESVAMDNPQQTIATLRELKRMGVMLAIDDFGTGYSSLNYLKLFPINRLKLDRSFVADIETDPNDAAICAATIGLAHNLGLDVVAEGVETQAQADYLRRLNCDIVQGYFYARPQHGEAAANWIAARNGVTTTI